MSDEEGTSGVAQRLMQQVLGTGLLSLEDIAAISSGDMSPVQRLLPLLLQDDGFKQLAAAQQQTNQQKTVAAVENVETNGRGNGAGQSQTPPAASPPTPAFPKVANEFAVRLGRLLANPKLGRQIQFNMQINTRGVTFQAVRFVQDGNGGVHTEPYLEAVRTPHHQTGEWFVQTLQECVARLEAEEQDAHLLESGGDEEYEGEEGEEAEEEVEREPRHRAPPQQRQQPRR